jgi:tRNA nucleotidyltransferase/poly(A) polymerase
MIIFNSNIVPPKKDAYLVGGAVRDILMGNLPDDFDFSVKENPKRYAMAIGENTNRPVITLGKPGFVLYRVLSPMGMFDVSPMFGDRIEEDLSNRDFTINAIAVATDTGEILDPYNGIRDIQLKKIRMLSDTSFTRDPIRLLRAYRFGAVFGFGVEKATKTAIKKNRHLISFAAGERIHSELKKIFDTEKAHQSVGEMLKNGLIYEIFPEVKDLKNCTQGNHHDFDVLDHTLLVLKHMESIQKELASNGMGIALMEFTEKPSPPLLKYAALFHDLGKPFCKTEKDGVIHFFGHEKKSMELFLSVSNRLKFSNDEKKSVATLIKQHLRPLFLYTDYVKGRLSKKSKTSFFMDCDDLTPEVLIHGFADFLAKRKDGNAAEKPKFAEFFRHMLDTYYTEHLPVLNRHKLIDGNDLIREFHISPSPLFRTILTQVEESRLAGMISTKSEALEMAKCFLETPEDHSSS